MCESEKIWLWYKDGTDGEEFFASHDGSGIYVARASIKLSFGKEITVPGEFVAADKKCYIAYNGTQHIVDKEFEVLARNEKFTWSPFDENLIYEHLVEGNLPHTVQNFWIGRVNYNGMYHVGTFESGGKICSVCIDGSVKEFECFDVLTKNECEDPNTSNSSKLLEDLLVESTQLPISKHRSSLDLPSGSEEKCLTKSISTSFRALPKIEAPPIRLDDSYGGFRAKDQQATRKLSLQGPQEFKKESNQEGDEVEETITQKKFVRLDTAQKIKINPTPIIPKTFVSYEKNTLTLSFGPVGNILEEMNLCPTITSLKIINVPNSETLNLLENRSFAGFIQKSKCNEIQLKTDDTMDYLTSRSWMKLSHLYKEKDKSMMISVDGEKEFQVGWRIPGKDKLLSTFIKHDKEKSQEVEEFIVQYLRRCLTEGHFGIDAKDKDPDKDFSAKIFELISLYDENGLSLLMLAAQEGNLEVVKFCLENRFDESYEVDGKIAIDYASKDSKNYSKIVLSLLNANSRFPKDFDPDSTALKDDLKEFVEDMLQMHESIKRRRSAKVKDIILKYPDLKYFFKPSKKPPFSVSAFTTAENYRRKGIIEELSKRAIWKASFELTSQDSKSVLDQVKGRMRRITRRNASQDPDDDDNSNGIDLPLINSEGTEQNGQNNNNDDADRNNPSSKDLTRKSSSSFGSRVRQFFSSIPGFCLKSSNKEKFISFWLTNMTIGNLYNRDRIKQFYDKILEQDDSLEIFQYLKLILEMVAGVSNIRIEFRKNSGGNLREWLLDDGSSKQYNNHYVEKRIYVDLNEATEEEVLPRLIQNLYIYCNYLIYKNCGKPYDASEDFLFEAPFHEALALDTNQQQSLISKEIYRIFDGPNKLKENEQDAELIASVAYVGGKLLEVNESQRENVYEENKRTSQKLFSFFSHTMKEFKSWIEKHDKKKSNRMAKIITSITIFLLIAIIIVLMMIPSKATVIKWENLKAPQRNDIFKIPLKYHGVDITLDDLMHQNCSHIKEVSTDARFMQGAIEKDLDPCIELSYETMKPKLKEKLEISIVRFQGETVQLKKICDDAIYRQLSSDQIKQILKEKFKVGTKFDLKLNLKFERSFVKRKGAKFSMTSNEIIEETKKEKIFILADESGAGKTTTMKNFTMALKHKFNNHWIQYIDVSKYEDLQSLYAKLLSNGTEQQIFKHLYRTNKVILLYDFGDSFNENFTNLIRKTKNESDNIQLVAVDYEHSRKVENELKTISHKFEALKPTMSPKAANFFALYLKIADPDGRKNFESTFELLQSDSSQFYENFESFALNELKKLEKKRRRRRRSSFDVEVLQKLALRKTFDDGVLEWKSIDISDMTRIDESSKDFFKKLAETSAEIITKIDGESFEFSHQSWRIFFVIQFFKEKLYDINDASEKNIEKIVKMLIHFSNNFDTKLSRKFVESLPNFEVKNEKVLKVLNEKFKDILEKFSETENPGLLLAFFKSNQSILGSPQKWLNDTFNIDTTKENERGKILYQIWKHRDHQSAKAIQSLTEIKVDKDFILDLKEKQTLREFLNFAIKDLTSSEMRKIFTSFNHEIFSQMGSKKNFDKIFEKMNEIFNQEELSEIYPQVIVNRK